MKVYMIDDDERKQKHFLRILDEAKSIAKERDLHIDLDPGFGSDACTASKKSVNAEALIEALKDPNGIYLVDIWLKEAAAERLSFFKLVDQNAGDYNFFKATRELYSSNNFGLLAEEFRMAAMILCCCKAKEAKSLLVSSHTAPAYLEPIIKSGVATKCYQTDIFPSDITEDQAQQVTDVWTGRLLSLFEGDPQSTYTECTKELRCRRYFEEGLHNIYEGERFRERQKQRTDMHRVKGTTDNLLSNLATKFEWSPSVKGRVESLLNSGESFLCCAKACESGSRIWFPLLPLQFEDLPGFERCEVPPEWLRLRTLKGKNIRPGALLSGFVSLARVLEERHPSSALQDVSWQVVYNSKAQATDAILLLRFDDKRGASQAEEIASSVAQIRIYEEDQNLRKALKSLHDAGVKVLAGTGTDSGVFTIALLLGVGEIP